MRLLITAKVYFFSVSATVKEVDGAWNTGQLSCERRLRVFPGCYYYIFPSRKLRLSSYRVVPKWYDPSSTGSATSVEFFIAKERPRFKINQRWLIDGPYGYDLKLHRVENVILAAKGVGGIGILSFALDLLERRQHDREEIEWSSVKRGQSSRAMGWVARKTHEIWPVRKTSPALLRDATSKIVILWKLDYNAQDQLMAKQLQKLQQADEDVCPPSSSWLFLLC